MVCCCSLFFYTQGTCTQTAPTHVSLPSSICCYLAQFSIISVAPTGSRAAQPCPLWRVHGPPPKPLSLQPAGVGCPHGTAGLHQSRRQRPLLHGGPLAAHGLTPVARYAYASIRMGSCKMSCQTVVLNMPRAKSDSVGGAIEERPINTTYLHALTSGRHADCCVWQCSHRSHT